MAPVEEKSMVPTVLVGVGGTGTEILSRVRRLVEEAYGGLKNFPILSFLTIDTDRDYKVTNPLAAGSTFKDNEKHWASVSGAQVREMMGNMNNFPWIDRWFPRELERNITALEAGAGQIRACGRFAFFCNYHAIQKKFSQACDRTKGHESFMLDKHGIRVSNTALNVFVTGSISGGTGSGMLIDLGYCVKHWLKGQASPLSTAIVPMPNAFAGIDVGDRVLANGYAALMELSYFSDYRTEYVSQFSSSLIDEVRSMTSPFDFTYLVGTKNGESDFKLDQIREMIAQNIFLDLTSDFAPHKRSIRDNIKAAWANQDPGGRGYPKNFMSFGLSTVEIPLAQIRSSLSGRLGADFLGWWLNDAAQLPPQVRELLQNDLLKRMRLTDNELIADLSAAGERSLPAEISQWVNSIRNEIATEDRLQCTQQGVMGFFSAEKGKILPFVEGYLKPKVDEYKSTHLRELSPDRRLHGDYFQKMYDNSAQIIQRGRDALENELYKILEDRSQGPKFADAFVTTARQIFEEAKEKFRREADKVWQPNEINRQRQYEAALQDITHYRGQFGISKQAKMEEFAESALTGLEGSLIAVIQRKARYLGLEVIERLQEHLAALEQRLMRWNQKVKQARDSFQQQANQQSDSADALKVNGIKLYDRQQLNGLYRDLIEHQAGTGASSKSRYDQGMDSACTTLTAKILAETSTLWKESRPADQVFRLFDLAILPDVQDEDWQDIMTEQMRVLIDQSPASSRLNTELAACDLLFRVYDDEVEVTNNLRIAYNKSKPLILLSQAVMRSQDAGFTPNQNIKVAVVGGRNTNNPAARKLLPIVAEFIPSSDAITPLGEAERHRIVFVQEIGGFSLRCIEGLPDLRRSYQDWKGETILAQRARLRGEAKDLPIPVHMQKDPPFWDVFPENPEVFKLVLLARALGGLQQQENRATGEQVIRYIRGTALDAETVDIASTWEEATQVLEVLACRPDREAIQKQVEASLKGAETETQKSQLYTQFEAYLKLRETELEPEGGRDSSLYKRDRAIILDVINTYKLKTGSPIATPKPLETVSTTSDSVNPEAIAVAPTIELPPPPSSIESPAVSPSPVTGSSPTPKTKKEALQELKALLDEGLITDEEYQEARKSVLGID
jgi:Tubulin like/Short C-terminal domain